MSHFLTKYLAQIPVVGILNSISPKLGAELSKLPPLCQPYYVDQACNKCAQIPPISAFSNKGNQLPLPYLDILPFPNWYICTNCFCVLLLDPRMLQTVDIWSANSWSWIARFQRLNHFKHLCSCNSIFFGIFFLVLKTLVFGVKQVVDIGCG